MERARRLLFTVEQLIVSRTKRHIVGGVLLSASVFLGGLAATVLTAKTEEKDEYEEIYDGV